MKKMKLQKKPKAFKRCPRCGNKCLINQEKCEECGLVFSKLQFASNRAAKKKLAHFDRDYVIFTNQLPADVSKVKLWLYLLLLGWVGGHFYYVGKYIKGLFMSLGFVYLVIGTVFNEQIVAANATLLYLPIAIYALSWIVSFSFVLSKRFKVPIYIDEQALQAERNSKLEEYDRVSQEIKQENEKMKNIKNGKAGSGEKSQNEKDEKSGKATAGEKLSENGSGKADSTQEVSETKNKNGADVEKGKNAHNKTKDNKAKNTKVSGKK